MRCCRQPAGLTLLEVLLVITLMAILAAAVIPNANPGIAEQLRSVAQVVGSDLDYTRSLAVTHGSAYRVSFEPGTNRYVLSHAGVNPLLDKLPRSPFHETPAGQNEIVVRLADLPNLGPTVTLLGAALSDGQNGYLALTGEVVFKELGQTLQTGPTRIWLAAGGGSPPRTISLSINPVTGLTTIEPLGAYPPPDNLLNSAAVSP